MSTRGRTHTGLVTTASDIHAQLLARCAETPYTVSEMPGGLLVHLDVADLEWMTLLHQNSLKKEYSIELSLDEANQVYREEQVIRNVTWRAGVNAGGSPQFTTGRSVQRGKFVEIDKSVTLGMNTRTGKVGFVGYAFDSRPMARAVDEVMKATGWTKKMGKSARTGLIVAGATIGGIIVAGLIVLIILLVKR